jgi:hypothetical protein
MAERESRCTAPISDTAINLAHPVAINLCCDTMTTRYLQQLIIHRDHVMHLCIHTPVRWYPYRLVYKDPKAATTCTEPYFPPSPSFPLSLCPAAKCRAELQLSPVLPYRGAPRHTVYVHPYERFSSPQYHQQFASGTSTPVRMAPIDINIKSAADPIPVSSVWGLPST